jgi:mannosidase alpha-like ER degradation enhancer 1
VVLDDRQGFENAVKNVIDWVSFDVNTKPQLFETTIRVLGGLLSGHLFANQTGQPFHLPWYRGELLDLAHDLGKRLLPAFSTPTGLPYARVFFFCTTAAIFRAKLFDYRSIYGTVWWKARLLKLVSHSGSLKWMPLTTNTLGTAGAGSLILEFATLSRLTGDDRFEKVARKVALSEESLSMSF